MDNKNKKIYITCLHLRHGGVEMAITLLANALVEREYDVEILCLYDLGQPAYDLDPRVRVIYLTDVKPNREAFLQALKRKNIVRILREGFRACRVLYLKKSKMKKAIRSIRTGTIISTRNEHSVLLSKYGQKGVKKIAQLHHDHEFSEKLLKDFRSHFTNIDFFVLLTEEMKEELEKIMADNHHTKLLAIPHFLPEMKEYAKKDREDQVVAVGRLHEEKGFLRLIDLWVQIPEKQDWILKIIGDGEQRDSLKERIRELGVEESVVLAGPMDHDNVMTEMGKSRIYAMTSRTEAFGFVLLEAMHAGLPIIAYDVRMGPRAVIRNDENGYLIPDGDEKKFIERMTALMHDKEKNERMSEQSKYMSKQFTEEAVIQKWINIL